MRPRTPRAQDVAYQVIVGATNKEKGSSKTEEEALKGLVNSLAASLKASTKVDISMPPKFQGNDSKWEHWYKLQTFDHPTGPGAPDFDTEINSSICNL
jgi:hypothetical protein